MRTRRKLSYETSMKPPPARCLHCPHPSGIGGKSRMVEPSARASDADVLMMRRRCHVGCGVDFEL